MKSPNQDFFGMKRDILLLNIVALVDRDIFRGFATGVNDASCFLEI
ncbi:hypothetical protein [Desertivirga xinjiangensis]|nr:hypothetical protein [Pedobacter xinjiangensis]